MGETMKPEHLTIRMPDGKLMECAGFLSSCEIDQPQQEYIDVTEMGTIPPDPPLPPPCETWPATVQWPPGKPPRLEPEFLPEPPYADAFVKAGLALLLWWIVTTVAKGYL